MSERYQRMELLFGTEAVNNLLNKRVAVFGAGGVGGSCIEALARSGIGTIDVFDNDSVALSNLNRQIMATESTLGERKTEAAKKRIHDINPDITVNCHDIFYLPDTSEADAIDFSVFDYVVDAIDTVTGKIGLIISADAAGVPVISCMGCGNRTDPTKLIVCDIYETKTDPLAKVMRHELRKRNIRRLCVVCSTEAAMKPLAATALTDSPKDSNDNDAESSFMTATELKTGKTNTPSEATATASRRQTPGSTAFVPPAAGLIAASVVVRALLDL